MAVDLEEFPEGDSRVLVILDDEDPQAAPVGPGRWDHDVW
jgi:hypothetical protein